MFTELIVKFDKRLDDIMAVLGALVVRVEDLFHQLEDHKTLVKRSNVHLKACANAFYQTREACEWLREELSAASGNLTQGTWLD